MTHPFVDIRKKMTLLLDLGQLLMENGASSNQILRDMRRAGIYMGISRQHCHVHISYNTIMLNINDDYHSYTLFRAIDKHKPNMSMLSGLSKLTWTALEEQYTLDEFGERIRQLATSPPAYPNWLVAICSGFACGAFSMLFGGSITAAWITTFCSLVAFFVRDVCNRWGINVYIGILITAFVGTTLAYASGYIFGPHHMIYALISSTLFMIPGVPLMNAIDDLINNQIVSGITRFVNTVLIMGSMTVGIAMALYFDIVSNFTKVNILPQDIYFLQLGAAFTGSIGFSILFNTPKRLLPFIGLGGIITVFIRNYLIVNWHFSLMGAAFLAAACISIITLRLAPHLKTASLVLAIPSVLPLIPGVLLYRFLFSILHINTLTPITLLQAEQSGVTGFLTIISIAIGVTIPNIFAQRYLDKHKFMRISEFLKARTRLPKDSRFE